MQTVSAACSSHSIGSAEGHASLNLSSGLPRAPGSHGLYPTRATDTLTKIRAEWL